MTEKYRICIIDGQEENKYQLQIAIENNKPTVEVVSQEHLRTIKSRRNIALEDISINKLYQRTFIIEQLCL